MSNWNDRPLFRLALAATPALAVATRAANGLALGVATGCALVLSSIVVAVLDNLISENGRVPLFILVSALFAGIAQMVMKAAWAETAAALGIYLPLIAVNCVLLARPDKQSALGEAISDSVKLALGYIVLVTLLGAVRELLDVGTLFGAQVLPKGLQLSALAALPAGGLMLLGLCAGVVNALRPKRTGKEDEAA